MPTINAARFIITAVFCYQEVASKGSINPAAAARAKARLKELRVTSR